MTQPKRDERQHMEGIMRTYFDVSLKFRLDRHERIPARRVIPGQHFAAVASQCREMYVDGYFFGCISGIQAVAEAIARLIAEKNGITIRNNHLATIGVLQQPKHRIISPEAFADFRLIHRDRNDYHHLDDDLERNRHKLQARAEECLLAMRRIQDEVFAFDVENGYIKPKHPDYWPAVTEGYYVYMQL